MELGKIQEREQRIKKVSRISFRSRAEVCQPRINKLIKSKQTNKQICITKTRTVRSRVTVQVICYHWNSHMVWGTLYPITRPWHCILVKFTLSKISKLTTNKLLISNQTSFLLHAQSPCMDVRWSTVVLSLVGALPPSYHGWATKKPHEPCHNLCRVWCKLLNILNLLQCPMRAPQTN